MTIIHLGEKFTLDDVSEFLFGSDVRIQMSKKTYEKVEKSRKVVEKMLEGDKPVYGINTGFGKLARTKIPKSDLAKLQENLLLSHACGVGEPLSPEVVRLMMLLRAHNLSFGYSGVRPIIIERLIDLLRLNIVPVIPSQGSVGASGDLAPLSHLALVLIGRGHAWYNGEFMTGEMALKRAGIKPVKLEAKEGLALINGTQAMTAMAIVAVLWGRKLSVLADIVASLTIEGDRASVKPFVAEIQKLRPHLGQKKTASNLRKLLANSKNISYHKNCKRVQDPYSIRCIPQVHGATKDALDYAVKVVEIEMNSVTDNPLVIGNEIISGGNFHGQPVAIAMDMLATAISELASISERRIFLLTAPLGGELPYSFLTPNAGLNSGFMIPHVTAAALVSENKMLSHPASVDSIPTSGGQEDHVSMGTISARRTLQITENTENVLLIELIASAQAVDLQIPKMTLGKGSQVVYNTIRKYVPFVENDVEMKPLFDNSRNASGLVITETEKVIGKLEC